MLTTPWLKQILKGEKRLLKMAEVTQCNPPPYDEISVANLYDSCIKLEGMAQFFPDSYPKGRPCNRVYFFSILSTVHPGYTQQLLLNSKKVRNSTEGEEQQKQAIQIDPEWERQLKEFPQFTSKCYILMTECLTYLLQSRRGEC